MSGFAVMVRGVDDTFSAYGPVRDVLLAMARTAQVAAGVSGAD